MIKATQAGEKKTHSGGITRIVARLKETV